MIIVKMKGGLGNQMFQYTFAKYVETQAKDKVLLDFSAYENGNDKIRVPRIKKFKISLKDADINNISDICLIPNKPRFATFWHRVCVYIEKTLNKNYYFESSLLFKDFQEMQGRKYLDGYWQSYKYINLVKDMVINEFTPTEKLSEQSINFISRIRREEAVFVGIRKGDYTKEKAKYGSFPERYYTNAMDYIIRRKINPVFYIFTNDVEWCKANLDFKKYHVIYREPDEQCDDFEELIIMASCKHAIISNSTYHWWGAYLIDNEQKIVIAPNNWFFDGTPIDIIPTNWVKFKEHIDY